MRVEEGERLEEGETLQLGGLIDPVVGHKLQAQGIGAISPEVGQYDPTGQIKASRAPGGQ